MKRTTSLTVFSALVFLLLGVFVYWLFLMSSQHNTPAPEAAKAVVHLADARQNSGNGFRIQDVPPWLFVHVGVLAALQALAVLIASSRAGKWRLSNTDKGVIRFLVEIPMYLGLFGTLLGVCLTQFISGTLVAPLAYLTTMNGIVLHVLGKLFVLLPIESGQEEEE